jgi:ABC-type branched-subunit amino acid transport system substrate-binding protein
VSTPFLGSRSFAALACSVALVTGCGSTVGVSRTVTAGGDGLESGTGLPPTFGLSGSPEAPSGGAPSSSAASGDSTRTNGDAGGLVPGQPKGGGGGQPPGSPAGIPAKGVGWDARSIYIGIPTGEDVHQYAGSLGISFDPGSLEADAKAVIADLNAKGGLFGRRLVPVFHDNATSDLVANPDAAAQRNCTAFTEDRPVVAVFNAVPNIDTENWHACLQQHSTPLLNGSSSLYDTTSFRQYGPYVWNTLEPNMSTFVPGWVTHLQRLSYFAKWDTRAGGPGSAPAKVGILMPDTRVSQRLAHVMKARLNQLGLPTVEYAYQDAVSSYGGDMSAAVLRFNSSGVTHVLSIPPIAAAKLVFMQTAEQQRYRPRYGMSSVDNPTAFVSNAPGAQLSGALGSGWLPGVDVDTAHDPGQTPAQRECSAIFKRAGLSFAGDGRRTALMLAFDACTSLKLLVAAARSAGGLAPVSLANGIASIGSGFPTAQTFHSGLSSTSPAMPDEVRDLVYMPSCGCFAYRGGTRRL